ncbi:MAG: gliding motility-associated lipoprotein GldH [Thalassomonas sp.]|jgi:gliding motility-associated lipoprotein GldH
MRTLVLIGTIVMFISCNNSVFNDYKTFSNQEWNADSLVQFKYSISDTVSENQIIIKVRHTVDYEFQNLFVFVKSEQTDTIELLLADKSGKWLGNGIGDVREVVMAYKIDKKFKKKGEYTLEVEQGMRYGKLEKIQQLKHINAIGLTIVKQDE